MSEALPLRQTRGSKDVLHGTDSFVEPRNSGRRLWGTQDFQAANESFRRAVEEHPKDAAIRVRWGRLFLDNLQAGDAAKLFQEALEINQNLRARAPRHGARCVRKLRK